MSGYPNYVLNCYDTGNFGALLISLPVSEGFNLTYSKVLNDIGTMAFTVPADGQDWNTIFADDNIIDLLRTDPNGNLVVEESYFVVLRDHFVATDGDRYVIGGYSLNELIRRAVVDPADDSVQPNGGFVTKAGDVVQVVRAYVRENIGDLASAARTRPRFSVPVQPNTGSNIGANLRYENLWDEMQKLAVAGGIELNIVHDGSGNIELELARIGTDRSVTTNPIPPYLVFDPRRGNLFNPRLLIDRKQEKNFYYVLGEGDGANRPMIPVVSTASNDTIYARREATVDARDASRGDTTVMLTSGAQALLDNRAVIEFSFDILPDIDGSIYRRDWFFGDTATFIWDNVQYDRRITELEVSLDESGENMSIKLSEVL